MTARLPQSTMTALTLTPTQRKSLKAIAHGLDPVVMIGDAGLTPAVLKEIDRALGAHELIKVRVAGDEREARIEIYEKICAELDAAPVQHIGKLLVLFRPAPERELPPVKAVKAPAKKARGSALSRPVRINPITGKPASPRTIGKTKSSISARKAAEPARPARPARPERVRASGQRSAKKEFQSR